MCYKPIQTSQEIFKLGGAQTPRTSENRVRLIRQLGGDFARLCDGREIALASKLNFLAVLPQLVVQAVEALDDEGVRN